MPGSSKVPSRLPSRQSPHRTSVVLIDGSALFLAARSLYEGRQLDYRALVSLLATEVSVEPPVPTDRYCRWVMWTSASPQNQSQNRFLDFVENELRWEVRRVSPADSYMVEPAALLGLSSEGRANRLVRFDASIAFAVGRLVDRHRIVVITDSFALADPLVRSALVANDDPAGRPVLAFFGRALDSRWQRVLRTEGPSAPVLVDLDDFEMQLFGGQLAATRPLTAGGDTFVF